MSTILITGASRGIGAFLARHLAAQGHVVYAGMRQPAPPAAESGAPRPIALDVTTPGAAAHAVAEIVARHGSLDVLINNAGVAWFVAAEEMSAEVLRTTMETNFFGAVACTQAALPHMRRQQQGRIIMISSLAAAFGLPLESAYCASKAALEAFSESMALEVRPFGINVAVIEPGITTGGLSTSVADPEQPVNSAYRELVDHTFAYYDAAQGALEGPELIADAVDEVIMSSAPAFRYRLGKLAPQVEAVLQAPPAQAQMLLADALDIGWWLNNEASAA